MTLTTSISRLKLSSFFMTALLIGFSAQANYIKGGLGVSLGGETKLDTGGLSTTTLDHRSSFMFPLIGAYGWELNRFLAVEGEFAVRSNEYDGVERSGQAATLGANVVGSFPVWKINLYGGAGANYGFYKLLGANKDWAFGAQAFAGVDYPLENGTRLGVEYRYFRALEDIDADTNVTAEYTSTAIILNAKFPF